jgi:hypothetical protein
MVIEKWKEKLLRGQGGRAVEYIAPMVSELPGYKCVPLSIGGVLPFLNPDQFLSEIEKPPFFGGG